jgi:hypothetical protein
VYNWSHLVDLTGCVPAGAYPQYTSSPHKVSSETDSVVWTTAGVGVCSIVGDTAGGAEVFVHPPTRTKPIPHTIRIRRGSLIQGQCYFDMINVFVLC